MALGLFWKAASTLTYLELRDVVCSLQDKANGELDFNSVVDVMDVFAETFVDKMQAYEAADKKLETKMDASQ